MRRSRALVALLALFTLSALVAESAWALVCVPATVACEADMAACAADAGAMTHAGGTASDAHHPAPPSDDSSGAPMDAAGCPMAMAAGGCATVALPAIAVAAQPEIVQPDALRAPTSRTPDLLVVAAHFRPPRA